MDCVLYFQTYPLQSIFSQYSYSHLSKMQIWLKNPWIIHHSTQSLNSLARCITPLVIWLLPPSESSYIFQCTIPLPFNPYINHNKMLLVHLRESCIMTLTSRSLPRQSPAFNIVSLCPVFCGWSLFFMSDLGYHCLGKYPCSSKVVLNAYNPNQLNSTNQFNYSGLFSFFLPK